MKKERVHKEVSSKEAYLCIAMVFGSVVLCLVGGLPTAAAMLVAAVVAFFFAMHLGYHWSEIEPEISDRMGRINATLNIMWAIGLFLGAILFSGTLPLLVNYGFRLMSPRHMYLSVLLICSILSVVTGSSWTSSATGGLAGMLVCRMLGGNEAIMAGAAICGAIFGDKISPMSETTNLAPVCAGTTLWPHIYSQLYTTGPAYIISIIFFAVMDATSGISGEIPAAATAMADQLGELYNLSPLLLIPLILLLILCITKQPAVPSLVVSSFVAVIMGVIVQRSKGVFTLALGASAAINGFSVSSITPEGMTLISDVPYLLDRGGMISMANVVILCFCGFAMTTIMSATGIMKKAVEPLQKFADTRFKMVLTAEIACITTYCLGTIGYVSSMFIGPAWRELYIRNGCGLQALSRTLEDVGTTIGCLVPWSQSAAFFVSALGVQPYGAGGYWKYVPMPYLCPIIALILAATGIGMYPLTPEQQEEEMQRARDEGLA